MILLFHIGGPMNGKGIRPCMGPAFGVKRKHDLKDMPAENVVKLNGAHPIPGEGMICGTCRYPVHLSWLSYVRPATTTSVDA